MDQFMHFKEVLKHSRGAEEITELMTATRRALGYASFTYAGLRPTENKHGTPVYLAEGMVALSDLSEAWVHHYMAQLHQHNDPVLRAAMSQTLPVVWGPDFLSGERSTGEDRMMTDASAWGLRYGITVTVRSCTGTLGMLSMTAPDPVRDDSGTAAHRFHLIAVHLHEHVQTHLASEECRPVMLSRRELDVLMWSSEGKTAGEIAGILDITTRTVNAHLSNAMRKLGVYSKVHAVARFLTQPG